MEFILGIFIGGLLCWLFTDHRKPKASGTFFIDFSDPLKDICRLELDEDINDIWNKKQIILNVKTREFDESSQE